MIKRLLLGVLACLAISTTFADEGMWLPSLIKERIKEMRKMGFKLKADDLGRASANINANDGLFHSYLRG